MTQPLSGIRRHALGVAAVLLTAVALEVFRRVWFEPRAIGLACLHGTGPYGICAARSVLGLLTQFQVLGSVALVLGIWAMASGGFVVAVAAVCAGVTGLIDYNVSWGMLGAALGVWVWLRAAPAGPGRVTPAVTRPGSAS
jgi:hypothetical protein